MDIVNARDEYGVCEKMPRMAGDAAQLRNSDGRAARDMPLAAEKFDGGLLVCLCLLCHYWTFRLRDLCLSGSIDS